MSIFYFVTVVVIHAITEYMFKENLIKIYIWFALVKFDIDTGSNLIFCEWLLYVVYARKKFRLNKKMYVSCFIFM